MDKVGKSFLFSVIELVILRMKIKVYIYNTRYKHLNGVYFCCYGPISFPQFDSSERLQFQISFNFRPDQPLLRDKNHFPCSSKPAIDKIFHDHFSLQKKKTKIFCGKINRSQLTTKNGWSGIAKRNFKRKPNTTKM